jgi:hypothetical protein
MKRRHAAMLTIDLASTCLPPMGQLSSVRGVLRFGRVVARVVSLVLGTFGFVFRALGFFFGVLVSIGIVGTLDLDVATAGAEQQCTNKYEGQVGSLDHDLVTGIVRAYHNQIVELGSGQKRHELVAAHHSSVTPAFTMCTVCDTST